MAPSNVTESQSLAKMVQARISGVSIIHAA
jgi:hypothetical protein